jgi:hypothetical protein
MGTGQERPSNWLVVPESYQALDQFKYEVASELGIQTPQNGYWGTMTSRDCGAVGGNITRKLVQLGEQQLMGTTMSSTSSSTMQ